MVYQLETIENNMQPICNQRTTIGIPKDSQKNNKKYIFESLYPSINNGFNRCILLLNTDIPFDNQMETQYR